MIRQQADAMVSSGMKDAGYQFVNIDEGWWQGTRDGAGVGQRGRYDQDFPQFSRWGFDYVKVDWCGGDHEG